ncbi:MAG: hypothetical protein WA057_06680 [Candidatus Magasanikiibacteriota bacterium]
MFSLWFYSLFFREIKIGKWQKMPENLANLSEKIMRNEPTSGKIFRPTPQKSWFITILTTVIFVGFFVWLFILGSGIGFFSYVWFKMQWFLVLMLFLVVYFFYYSILSNWLFPNWLKKKNNHYFIYVGPEGILRKDYFRACFIPWSVVSGAMVNHSYWGEDGSSLSLDLFIKDHKVWNPMLVNSYAHGSFWYGLVTYSMDDMFLIANNIKNYAKEIGFKIN